MKRRSGRITKKASSKVIVKLRREVNLSITLFDDRPNAINFSIHNSNRHDGNENYTSIETKRKKKS